MNDVINVRFYTNYNVCNYSCAYCIAGQNQRANVAAPWDSTNLDPIVENLTRLPFRINIRLGVGGEFFLSRRLVAAARKLSHAANVQSVNLITNLSFSAMYYKEALAGFDKRKVAIVASYHPSEIRDRGQWLAASEYMRENFDFAVIVVGYPPLLASLPALKRELTGRGLSVFVQGFAGEYDGKSYPYAYTAEERKLLRSVCYSRHDYEFFIEAIKPRLCNAGCKSFYVDMSGVVVPCGMGIEYESMGDLSKAPEVRLHDQPRMCRGATSICDTENMNTVVFARYYEKTGGNQHVYKYRHAEAAKLDPALDEWAIDYQCI